MICTRCGKHLKNELFYELSQSVTINKIQDNGLIEQMQNVTEPTHEYLCEECFNAYVDKMNELVEETEIKALINKVEVIDDVQFGD